MFLKLFAVVTVEDLINGYYVSRVHAPRPFRLTHRRAHDIGHFGEQVERMVGGVLDGARVELLQRRVPHVHGHFSRIAHRRLVQHVIRNERKHG